MKPLNKCLILLAVVVFYTLIYIASSYPEKCDEQCQKIYQLDTTLSAKFNYFSWANRCSYSATSDTLCILVKDTVGINWNLFADTVCMYANSIGLYNQKIFVIKDKVFPTDTVARKQCP